MTHTTGNAIGSATGTGLVDARALWWREPDTCGHADWEWDVCECRTTAGWVFDTAVVGLAGRLTDRSSGASVMARYVTDRRLLIRADRLANWPTAGGAGEPYLVDLSGYPGSVAALEAMLAAREVDGPVTREFALTLYGPLAAAGYEVRPLAHDSGVHAVVDAAGQRVGLLMPVNGRPGQTAATPDTPDTPAAEAPRAEVAR